MTWSSGDPAHDELMADALQAAERAYSPYEGFPVGAAVLARDGSVILGCNVENSSYGLTICAERSAMFAALAQGHERGDLLALAVACPNGDLAMPNSLMPCGACRQVMHELLADNAEIIVYGVGVFSKLDLLPRPFELGGFVAPGAVDIPAAVDDPADGLITGLAKRVCELSAYFSISSRVGWDNDERKLQDYVAAWLVLLCLLLAFSPTSIVAVWLVMFVAFYRLQDLLFSSLDNALELTDKGGRFGGFHWRTPILIALVNIIQVVVIFAIAYLELTGHPRTSFNPKVSGRFGYFFASWNVVPPLGSGTMPVTLMARSLSITESAVVLLLVVIALSRFLSKDK